MTIPTRLGHTSKRGTFYGTYKPDEARSLRSAGRTDSTFGLKIVSSLKERPASAYAIPGAIAEEKTALMASRGRMRPRSALPSGTNKAHMELEIKTDFSTAFTTRGCRARKEQNESLLFYEEKFEVCPRNVDIGSIAVGSKASKGLRLTNMGSITSRIRVLPSSNADVTAEYEPGATKVAPGITTRINITAKGSAMGAHRATVDFFAGKELFRIPVHFNVISVAEYAAMKDDEKKKAAQAAEDIRVDAGIVPKVKFTHWDSIQEKLVWDVSSDDAIDMIMSSIDGEKEVEEVKEHLEMLEMKREREAQSALAENCAKIESRTLRGEKSPNQEENADRRF